MVQKVSDTCIFCTIAKHEAPAYVIDETAEHMAIMDIFPPTFNGKITMPVILVITKQHLKSDVFEDLSDAQYTALLAYTKRIARAAKRALNAFRVCMVFEGVEIDHIHTKLYPLFKEYYPNYLSTEKSPGNKSIRADDRTLAAYAERVRNELVQAV